MRDIGKVLRYLIPYWPKALLNIFLIILSSFFSLFTVMLFMPFLDVLFDSEAVYSMPQNFEYSMSYFKEYGYYIIFNLKQSEGAATALFYLCLVIISMSLLRNVTRYMSLHIMAALRNNVVRDIRDKLFKATTALPLSFFSEEKKGDIMSRMSQDVQEIQNSIMSSLEMIFQSPIELVLYLTALFMMSTNLTFFVFLMLPIAIFVIGRIGRTLKKQSRVGQSRAGGLLAFIEEALYGLRIIKAFNAEKRVNENFERENQKYTDIMVKVQRKRSLANPLTEFLGTIIMVVIMWYGGSLVLSGEAGLSSSGFIVYLMTYYFVITPAKSFSTAYYSVQKGVASIERINVLFNADIKIREKENAKPLKEFEDKIVFEDVDFKYQVEGVLKGVNVEIKKGQTVALVGQSGSGKSTLVDLIPRFHDVTGGRILIDGVPVEDLRISDLRANIGFVNQEPILFNDSFINNIAFGEKKPDLQKVKMAAKVANAHDFIIGTPEGYDTNIGDRGGKLSGGQRQRISIARAVYKNPPILILD
ncbi:MAG: ABC transporter ATP-binding protein, partial [Bacteroidales bacterium]|nr:ABC transporter ATP-binding protein [Bacteroidales bacterium]